ncbi:18254_t:CDS:2 [Entrophospora sp. SA101]|nr:18254_t:CDS:2 [Entrophospora sp. SA101]
MNPTNNSIEESNYPNDPIIKYTNKGSVSSNFIYEVINIGHYPENYKTTHGSSHPIPDNYKIKTTFVKNTITCSINYNKNNDPVYRIDWVDDVNKFNVIFIKSATEAVDLFLKRSRVISIGQSILQTFENSKSSALNINKNLEQATLVKTTFETNGTQYELTYDKKNSNAEEEAIVKVLDEHNIEKKNQSEKIPIFTFNTSFEKTVKSVTNDMDIDDDTEEISENILVAEESHGNGVRRNIKDILYSLIPYFIENGILKDKLIDGI